MKTFKFLLIGLLMAWGLTLVSQPVSLFYSYKSPTNPNVTLSRTESFDKQYGVLRSSQPYPYSWKLGYNTGVDFKMGNALYNLLSDDIWGPDGNLTFDEYLPNLTPSVPQYILDINGEYAWHPYDPANPATWPTANPGNGRGWECEVNDADPNTHMYYQNLDYTTASVWGALNIFQYRQQKLTATEPVYTLNPMYAIVEAERAAQKAEYEQILKDNLVMMGSLKFPSFPKTPTYAVWKWKEGTDPWVVIPYDANFWLISPSGGWIQLWRMLPASTPNYERQWDGFVNRTIMMSGSAQLKALAGIY